MRTVKIRDSRHYKPKSEWLAIRLTVKQKKKIIEHAYHSGLSVSDFIRQRLCYEAPDMLQQVTVTISTELETFPVR